MVIITIDKATNIVFFLIIIFFGFTMLIMVLSVLHLKGNKSKKEKFSDDYKYEAFKLNVKFKNPITLQKATNVFKKNYEKQRNKYRPKKQ